MRHLTMPVNNRIDDTDAQSHPTGIFAALVSIVRSIVLLIVSCSPCTGQRHITTTEQQSHQENVLREHATYLANARAAEEQRRQNAVRAQEAWKQHKVAAEANRARIEREARAKATIEIAKIPISFTIPSSSRATNQHNLKHSTAKRETIIQVSSYSKEILTPPQT